MVAVVAPLLHRYVIGATPPPVIVTVAVPSLDWLPSLAQATSVPVALAVNGAAAATV